MQTNVKKNLILLTKTYPYGNGEQYITNELEYLSKAFEKIIIYPNDYYSNEDSHSKILPNNIEVLNFNLQLPKKSKNKISDYLYLFKNTFWEFVTTDDKRNFFENFKWNLLNFWTQLQIEKSFSGYLRKNSINSSNTVFYSYWFHKSAILLSILKDKRCIDKFVSRAHSVDLYHQYWGIIDNSCKVPPFKMFKLKHVSALLTISNHGYLFLKKKYSAYLSTIELNYLGVIDDLESIGKEDQTYFHIITCSGIDYNKRIHKLAEALCKITKPVKWTHFGAGDMLEEVQHLVNRMPKNIEIDLKGNTLNKDILSFYASTSINLFVNLSIVEGLPVSIMEAMAYKIPILATNIYGTPEAVIDGKNGFLMNVNFTIDELVEKINYCIENKELLTEMSRNSYSVYKEKFNAEKNYRQFAEYLLNL